MTEKEFKKEYGKYALDVLTLIYISGASSTIPTFKYSTILNPEIKKYLKLPETTYVQYYVNKLESKSLIRKDTKGAYRKIYINENLPKEIKNLVEARKKRANRIGGKEMTYKTKKIFGMDFWDGIPEDVNFYDPESPTFQDLTKEEFNGFIKGINLILKEKHFSTDSEEYQKLYEEFENLLPEGKKVLASFSLGMLVGFRELPGIFNKEKK